MLANSDSKALKSKVQWEISTLCIKTFFSLTLRKKLNKRKIS